MDYKVSSRVTLACAAGLAAATLGCRGPDRLVIYQEEAPTPTPYSDLAAGQIAVSRQITTRDGTYSVDLGFTDQGGTAPVRFDVSSADDESWGYREQDIARLQDWHESARQSAWRAANSQQSSQAQFNAELKDLQAEYGRKRRDYIVSQNFKFLPDGSIEADIPALVRKNAPRLAPMARAMEKSVGIKSRAHDWLLRAATAMVQAAIAYQPVSAVIDGIHTGGIWPPVYALIHGRGDCDTKAALLASILANVPGTRILGIKVSGHYLLGVLTNPAKNDSYIQYQGEKYLLVEPAGPAQLPPGTLSEGTKALFKEGIPYDVDRLF
ncbi:MAG: hypothetical protein WC881_04500 [Elusimicrobiota bacterium]|jgi:transglutaminase-like putative cysteine protease